MLKIIIPVFLIMCGGVAIAMKLNAQYATETETASADKELKSYNSFRPEAPGPRAAVLKRDDDNHFWADANVDGTRVRFMVDTGATSVALTRTDALKLGYRMNDLDFRYKVATAGGETTGAFVLLDEIKIGNVTIKDVEALVIQSDLETSLLGMSYLNELHSFEVRQSSMIIRQ